MIWNDACGSPKGIGCLAELFLCFLRGSFWVATNLLKAFEDTPIFSSFFLMGRQGIVFGHFQGLGDVCVD